MTISASAFWAMLALSASTLAAQPQSRFLGAEGRPVRTSVISIGAIPHYYENYRDPAENRLIRRIVDDLNAREYLSARNDLEFWSRTYPTSDLGDYRRACLALVYYRTRQYDRAIDAAAPLIGLGLDHLFPGDGEGASLRLQVLAATAFSIGQLSEPSYAQLRLATAVARQLAEFRGRDDESDDSVEARSRY